MDEDNEDDLRVVCHYLAIDLIEGKASLLTKQVANETYDDEGEAFLPQ